MPPPTVQKRLFSETDIEVANKLTLKKVKVLESVSRPTQALLAPTTRCIGMQAKAATRSVAVQTEEVLSSNKAINTNITSLSGFSFSSHYYCSSSSFGHATPMEGVEFTGALKLAPVQAAEAAVTTDSTPTEARSANSASRAIQRGEKPRRIATPRPRRRTNVHGGKMA